MAHLLAPSSQGSGWQGSDLGRTLPIHDGRDGRTALHSGGNVGDGDADVTAHGVVGG